MICETVTNVFTYKWENILMRKYLIIVCMMFYSIAIGQPSADIKEKERNARNNIKSKISWDFPYSGNQPANSGNKTSVTSFNNRGEIVEVTAYNSKGEVSHVEKYEYDNYGKRTGYTRFSGEEAKQPAYQKLSSYDSKGNITEESGFDGVERFRNLYTYEDGVLMEIRYETNSILKERRAFTWNGNTTTILIYNSGGNIVSRLLLEYDSNGNLTEESILGVDESEIERKTFNYDNSSKLTEAAKYQQNRFILKTLYTYNKTGDLLEVTEESSSKEKFVKKTYSYDGAGNLIEMKWRRKDTESFNSMVYSYDNKGICSTVETLYPDTNYKVLTRYAYEFY